MAVTPPPRPVLRRLRQSTDEVLHSLWLVPAVIVLGGVLLAVVLVQASDAIDAATLGRFPRLFGAGAAGARGMLSTIAGSMITVAGVTFSITIAAVSQTSAQYTPRVLRTFMGDRANQVVLGTFVGIFAYCLVVLRTIRGGDEGAFVPPTAVLGGFLLALVGVGVLIYFIVHITQSLEAASILDRVRHETEAAVDRLFPNRMGEPAAGATRQGETAAVEREAGHWRSLRACTSGYIQRVDEPGLIAFARARGAVLRMELGVGDFAVAGAPLASIAPGEPDGAGETRPSRDDEAALHDLYTISPYRTVAQDTTFGVLQIVDIALKALSPGINDTTTAVTCVAHLSAVMARVAQRRIPELVRVDEAAAVRVLAIGPTFAGLAGTAFDDVRRNAAGNVTVFERLLDALERVGSCTDDPTRRQVLAAHAERVAEAVGRTVDAPEDRTRLLDRASAVRVELATAESGKALQYE